MVDTSFFLSLLSLVDNVLEHRLRHSRHTVSKSQKNVLMNITNDLLNSASLLTSKQNTQVLRSFQILCCRALGVPCSKLRKLFYHSKLKSLIELGLSNNRIIIWLCKQKLYVIVEQNFTFCYRMRQLAANILNERSLVTLPKWFLGKANNHQGQSQWTVEFMVIFCLHRRR